MGGEQLVFTLSALRGKLHLEISYYRDRSGPSGHEGRGGGGMTNPLHRVTITHVDTSNQHNQYTTRRKWLEESFLAWLFISCLSCNKTLCWDRRSIWLWRAAELLEKDGNQDGWKGPLTWSEVWFVVYSTHHMLYVFSIIHLIRQMDVHLQSKMHFSSFGPVVFCLPDWWKPIKTS